MAPLSPSSSSFPTAILYLLLFFPPPSLSSPSVVPANAIANPNPSSGLVSFTGGKGNYPMMAREFLTAHNKVRSTVAELPFQWDKQLARLAKRWSEARRSDCALEHSGGPFGENMFWGSGWTWRATDAVTEWASEKDFYDVETNSCAEGRMCGHFTQIVWNSTVRIGCGRTECYRGGVIITCNYDPPGNYVGEFPLNATA